MIKIQYNTSPQLCWYGRTVLHRSYCTIALKISAKVLEHRWKWEPVEIHHLKIQTEIVFLVLHIQDKDFDAQVDQGSIPNLKIEYYKCP